jgi:hypothetical protein
MLSKGDKLYKEVLGNMPVRCTGRKKFQLLKKYGLYNRNLSLPFHLNFFFLLLSFYLIKFFKYYLILLNILFYT